MKGSGELMYKSIEQRDGGSFTNDKGQVIKYDACYVLKVDDIQGSKIEELKLKIPSENRSLVEKLKSFAPYTKIKLDFVLEVKGNNTKIIPTEVTKQQ